MLLELVVMMAIETDQAAAAVCAKFANYQAKQKGPDADEIELAEMFANGKAVKRDLAAATHFACKADIAAAELWGMLDHLELMRKDGTGEPLDFCQHATSGTGSLRCALRRDEVLRPELAVRYEKVRTRSDQARTALDALRKRADAFVKAESHWLTEQTRGGTIYPSMGVWTLLEGEESFVKKLEQYSRERAPAASAAELEKADAALNAAYRERRSGMEAPEPEHLRDAQREWIAYRDAFITFYVERWRGTAPPDALRREIAAQLTRGRTGELLGDR
ncbi:MAG TPA: lysozyme inhibitor LprI family protein [Thermoanaerobaculia bacterium]|nr:lysozyme inhibitor LprI family protein [Thermoanaerobaculia bacterium]